METVDEEFKAISQNDKIILVVASILALWVSYQLFFKIYELDPGENAVELGTIETTGTIRRRHAKSLAWGDAEGVSKLYLRDIIITPKEYGATVSWGNNQSLYIEPDTMVQFDEVTNDRIQIVLFEGKVKQKEKSSKDPGQQVVVKKEETTRIIPYPKTVKLSEVLQLENTDNTLTGLNEKLKSYLAKEIAFFPLEPISEISPFKLNRVTDFHIRMLSPERGKFDIGKDKWVKFSWAFPKVQGVSYEIEVSKKESFEEPKLSHKTKKPMIDLQIFDPGKYYWRVRAVSGTESQTSLTSDFELLKKSGVDVFSRLPTGQPSGYSWEIALDKKFEKVIKNGVSDEPKCQPNDLVSGNYFCRIRDVTSNVKVNMYSMEVK